MDDFVFVKGRPYELVAIEDFAEIERLFGEAKGMEAKFAFELTELLACEAERCGDYERARKLRRYAQLMQFMEMSGAEGRYVLVQAYDPDDLLEGHHPDCPCRDCDHGKALH